MTNSFLLLCHYPLLTENFKFSWSPLELGSQFAAEFANFVVPPLGGIEHDTPAKAGTTNNVLRPLFLPFSFPALLTSRDPQHFSCR